MERFISTPNLPENNTSLVVIDGRVSKEIEATLYNLNIRIIKTEKISTYEAISYHPDIMLHHLGDSKIIVAPNISNKLVYKLEDEGFEIMVGRTLVEDKYPKDVAYNVARVDDKAICNVRYTDEVLLNELTKRNAKIIDVRQGYSKCSISILNENAIITSDRGIFEILINHGVDILLIQPGHVELKGLNYGFIGGATGLISKNVLALCGCIDYHPDSEGIKRFLSKHKIKYVELSKTPLLDYGTLIPLKEYPIL